MISVRFLRRLDDGQYEVEATIGWDGRQWVGDLNNEFVATAMQKRLYDPDARAWVTAAQPERFLKCLQYAYHSAYFKASPPESDVPLAQTA